MGRRLTFVLPRLEGGGGLDRIAAVLAGELVALGSPVDVVRVSTEYRNPASLPPGVGDVDLRARRVSRAVPGFVRYLRRHRPRALIAAAPMGNLLALGATRLARTSTPVVACTQNDFTTLLSHARHPKHRATLALLERWYPTADALLAVSHGLATRVADLTGVPTTDIHVVRNPVLTDAFRAGLRTPVAHPWFAGDGPPVVITVARMSPLKDLPTLLAAFDRLRRQRPARLAILGDGPQRAEIEDEVARRGLEELVWLPGFVADPQRYLAHADVFALSSRSEGLGNALVEALAAGLPVVATDAPHGPREILDGGRLGRLVPVGDDAALAHAFGAALDEARPVPPSGDLAEYEATHVARRYLEIIEQAEAGAR